MSRIYILPILLLLAACSGQQKTGSTQAPGFFDKQGHRGSRGLMPENTIPAMLRAIDEGVTTLELDVVISRDSLVVVSHDPYFHHNISTKPNGSSVTKAESQQLLLFNMNYDSIKKYDVGTKVHPDYPRQQKIAVVKPLLKDLVMEAEKYALEKNNPVGYNIEIKSQPSGDGVAHPHIPAFTELVIATLQQTGTLNRTVIQSFDVRPLQYLHKHYPQVTTSLLMLGTDTRSLEQQLSDLGFTPAIYSPHYSLVTPKLIADCRAKNIKVIPWTVNSLNDIRRLKAMGVDGIITDYPDLFNQL